MTTAHKKSRLTGLLVIAAIASPTALMADTLSVGKLLERAQSRSQTQAVGILVARLGGERAGPAPAEIRPSTVAVEPETSYFPAQN